MDTGFGQYIPKHSPLNDGISRYVSVGDKPYTFSKPLLSKNIGIVNPPFFDLIKRSSGRRMNNEYENITAPYNQRESDMRMVKNLYFDLLKRGANFKDFTSTRRFFEEWLNRCREDSMGIPVSSIAYNIDNDKQPPHLFYKSLNKNTPSLPIGKRHDHPMKMKSGPAMVSRFQKPTNLKLRKMLYYSLFNREYNNAKDRVRIYF